MSKPVRFERTALEQLDDIATWTLDRFGPAQAAAYEDVLVDRVRKLADGTAHSRALSATDPRRMMQAGQHIFVYTETAQDIRVLAVLHSRSDFLAHLPSMKDT